MAAIKSCTDIPQSKKLAKVLPLESANMYYDRYGTPSFINEYVSLKNIKNDKYKHLIPCWSLAALLDILPPIEGFRPIIDLDINLIRYEGNYRDELCFNGNNLVDACVAMIEKLHEIKMI